MLAVRQRITRAVDGQPQALVPAGHDLGAAVLQRIEHVRCQPRFGEQIAVRAVIGGEPTRHQSYALRRDEGRQRAFRRKLQRLRAEVLPIEIDGKLKMQTLVAENGHPVRQFTDGLLLRKDLDERMQKF